MTQINRKPPSQLPPGAFLGIGIGFLLYTGYLGLQHLRIRQLFDQGHQAYEQGDCQGAIPKFKQVMVIKSVVKVRDYSQEARVKKAECDYYQSGMAHQAKGQAEPALYQFGTLVRAYGSSALIPFAREAVGPMFGKSNPQDLATERVCERLEALMTHQMIPTLAEKAPPFYLHCGQRYEQDQQLGRAQALYEKGQQHYPQADLWTPALARVMVADVREQGAKPIPPAQRVGSTGDGSSVIEITNSSPREMKVALNGPTPKFETIPPCEDCQKYHRQGPQLCPEQGTTLEIPLEPGQYDLSIRFTKEGNEKISSGVGNWQLQSGARYNKCFVIVTDLEDEELQEEKWLDQPSPQ